MKYIIILFILLSSFILTGCENNEENLNAKNQNFSKENNFDNQSGEKVQRISYQEYVEKYDIDTEDNNTTSAKDNSNSATNSEDEIANNENNTSQTTTSNELASFSTPLLSSSNERINNLEIVCERLNNFILNPHETFSYNNELGPYGPDDGFEKAPILLSNGEKTKGYGGGVCQLSSTLYNVVKNIENIEITERHHHSAPVGYVSNGNDATVSLQSNLDFKFTNNNDYAIKFKAQCANGKISVWAYKEG